MGRPLVLALVALVLAGTMAFVLIDRPWVSSVSSSMSSGHVARALAQRLGTADRYTCSRDSGLPVPGEPDWTYECVNAGHPQRSGYFVLSQGDRITNVRPSG